MSSHVLGGATM